MYTRYYISLALGVLLCSIVPITLYYLSAEKLIGPTSQKTKYYFEIVDGPIQPIPRKVDLDNNWLILGKALFHSPLLSKSNTISCSSCHMVDFGGDDGFPVSTGVDNAKGVRNSPTVLNAVFNFRQFWDGRVSTLSEQASGPIHNPIEMASSWPEIITKLNNDSYFSKNFLQLTPDGITAENIVKAITIYEESLITPNSPIDQYLLGDNSALSAQQKRGLDLFINYGCTTCHQGRNIGGNIYQKLGRINDIPPILTLDEGKYNVTKLEKDKFVFKVPTLRNIADTAPYFHNGAIDNLPDAVRIMASTQLGRELTHDEVDDIVALLHAFSSKVIEVQKIEAL
ncbi:cytochrome-c peroxidase [Colwellia sp. 12G3]|uniref:cytochrome-c peroxidase n=1 Tax=Colwellia sp. 12G3 TaxID=2058299 RepID=UPI000C335E9C|nr:cytochrome-c peroxidase [Colwellia sp. 12G3]PKI17823.1 cytochrome-c peroxidase [Colwellia sp. 12G3]